MLAREAAYEGGGARRSSTRFVIARPTTIPRHAQANDPAMRVDQQSHTVAKATSRLPRKTSTPGTTPANAAMSRALTAQVCGTLTRFATESGI